ncbi:hypothetical protein Tco_0644103, partial [Tanacetum coccineum]
MQTANRLGKNHIRLIGNQVQLCTKDGYNSDNRLKAIEVTNKKETATIWSELTDIPLYNAIVWIDTLDLSEKKGTFEEGCCGGGKSYRELTGAKNKR